MSDPIDKTLERLADYRCHLVEEIICGCMDFHAVLPPHNTEISENDLKKIRKQNEYINNRMMILEGVCKAQNILAKGYNL